MSGSFRCGRSRTPWARKHTSELRCRKEAGTPRSASSCCCRDEAAYGVQRFRSKLKILGSPGKWVKLRQRGRWQSVRVGAQTLLNQDEIVECGQDREHESC